MANTIEKIYGYFEKNKNLRVLFVFDAMSVISAELMGVDWKPGYRYMEFDGKSWFNLKFRLETEWKEDKVILVLNQPCPTDPNEMLEFPLLDLMVANAIYREETHREFMDQYDIPEAKEAFVASHIKELTQKKFEDVLQGFYNAADFTDDNICRGFISVYLKQKRVLDWEHIVARIIKICAESDSGANQDAFFRLLMANKDANTILQTRLVQLTGQEYQPNTPEKIQRVAESIKYNSITRYLQVEPNDRYAEFKISDSRTKSRFNLMLENLRNDNAVASDFKKNISKLAADIKEEEIIKVYGVEAKYGQMTDAMSWPILRQSITELMPGQSRDVLARFVPMLEDHLFETGSMAEKTAKTLCSMANYFIVANASGSMILNTPDEYIDKYVKEYFQIDTYYRKSLEGFYELTTTECLVHNEMYNLKRQLDIQYSQKCNDLNVEWLRCLVEEGKGFNAVHFAKQQDFYKDNIQPSKIRQAVVISDALRYEVAVELMKELGVKQHSAEIKPAIAMLPSETKYCKTALFPHENLVLNEAMLKVDGGDVISNDQRSELLSKYKENSICIDYTKFIAGGQDPNRELVKQRPVLYFMHDVIDKEGHDQSASELIDACKKTVFQLAEFVHMLHTTYAISEVYITADHGFLFEDKSFEDKDKHQVQEDCLEKKTRYYLTTDASETAGIQKFAIETVSGMEADGVSVAVPVGTNRLMAAGGYSYAHGGAALQEIIVPVIHSTLKRSDARGSVEVSLVGNDLSIQSSILKFNLLQNEAVSAQLKPLHITYAVYANGNPISRIEEADMDCQSENVQERIREFALTIQHVPAGATALELRIYGGQDKLNPIISRNVRNTTLIEMDF